ncbi:MmcQ/YjbR family DNA-binding protein [Candidatus Saccharibacteria bacterium]|nr:MmcQ/YjbR family DNA-binding protein [Candidatus Saccharibacteria bacterium]
MEIDVKNISGIGEFTEKVENGDDASKKRTLYFVNDKAFLVVNKNTVEVRCDDKLAKVLREKYESVMESRYFGRGGIEIVTSGQLSAEEVDDLIRLSYNLTNV